MANNRFKTTITKKDGTTASGYIENDRGYYDDGTALSAGDSIIDAQNKVWTKADASAGAGAGTGSTGNNTPNGADALINYANQIGVNVPAGIGNYPTGNSSTKASYSVSKAEPADRTPLRSARELGQLYDINYNMDAIRKIYDDATNLKYALKSKELKQAENDFYANQANANATLLDSLRKATSSAIATGASRGLASAEQLGLAMEAQQGIIEGATDIAQDRANMADEIALEKAENIAKALEYSNQLKQGLATNSTNIYSADTQYDVGMLDFLVNNRNVDALLEQIASQEKVNYRGQDMDALKAILTDARDAYEGDANRKLQKEMNDDNLANALKTAKITAAGYASGGYGNNIEGDDWDKIWNKGDRNQAIKYLREHWGMTWQEANDKLNSDQQFLLNEKYRGYSNVPSYLMNKGNVKIITNKTATDIAKDAAKNNTGSKKDVYNITYEKDGSQTVWYRDGSYAIIPADLGEKEKTDYSHLSSIPAQFTAGPSK